MVPKNIYLNQIIDMAINDDITETEIMRIFKSLLLCLYRNKRRR